MTKADRQVEIGGVRRRRGHLQHTDTIEPAGILCACREHDVMNSRLPSCKQTRFIAADREMKAETFAQPIKVKELMALAAGLPTIFQDREDVWLEGACSYWCTTATRSGRNNARGRGSNEATKHGKMMHP